MPVSINVLNMMRLADCIVRLIDPFKARTGFKNVLPENCNKATNSQIRSKKNASHGNNSFIITHSLLCQLIIISPPSNIIHLGISISSIDLILRLNVAVF